MALANRKAPTTPTRIESWALVDDVMRNWPATVGVIIHWHKKCVGCPFGVFHSIEHACDEHSGDMAGFVAALQRAVAEDCA